MTDHQPLFDRLEALVDRNKLPDWDDVVRRVGLADVPSAVAAARVRTPSRM